MYTLDYPQNFAISKIDPIAAGATSVTVESISKFSDPEVSGEYNCVIFNQNTGPADDPTVEIVRVTAKSGSVLTITRGQESTSDSDHNTNGKMYVIAAVFTAKMIIDIDNSLYSKAPLVSPSFTTPSLGVASATSINKITITQPATAGTLTIVDGQTLTCEATASVSGTNTGDNATNTQYSGLAASKADVAQTFYIGTTQVAINRASAALTLAGLTLTTPDIGVATATSVNKVAFTAPANGSTLTIADAKTLTCNNTLTLTATDGSTLAIGTGGTLGTGAYATIANYAPLANPTFTGTVILPKTIEIQDTSADHQYVLGVSELTADRTVTLPLLTGADEFVFKDHTATLTNKRITKRVVTTTDDATAVIDVDITDVYELSAVANATELSTTGTPTNGQMILIRLKDAGAAKGLTWTGFTAIGCTLPTTTVAGKWHYIGIQYNTAATAWHAISVSVQS